MFDINTTNMNTADIYITVALGFFTNGIFLFTTLLIGFFMYRRFIAKETKVDFQTYISGESSHIICHTDSYSVKDIPKILLAYRKKLKTTSNKEELYFWKTRVSTFILFTDGKRILLHDRIKNKEAEAIHNPKLDAYGAKAFHNGSLRCKLPKQFMELKILNMESISGVVIENTTSFFLHRDKKEETVIMLGFIAYMDPKDLEIGLEISTVENCGMINNIDKGDNIILSLSCVSVDDENLTAKTKLGIKYLHSKYENKTDDLSCKNNSIIKPFIYTSKNFIENDDLTLINGIGFQIEKMLNNLGIYKIEQIATWTAENIQWVNDYLYFPGRVEREKWVKQAQNLLENKRKACQKNF